MQGGHGVRCSWAPLEGGELRSRKWRFYHTATGKQIVREELNELDAEPRARILEAMQRIRRIENFPYELEHIEGDLQAVRVFFAGCTYRVLFAAEGQHDAILLALHVMQKKSRKLPPKSKQLAERRLRSWRERSSIETLAFLGKPEQEEGS